MLFTLEYLSFPLNFGFSFFWVVRFYTECFGMKVLRQRDIPEEKYSNAFLGFGPEESHFVVELTYSELLRLVNWISIVLTCDEY